MTLRGIVTNTRREVMKENSAVTYVFGGWKYLELLHTPIGKIK